MPQGFLNDEWSQHVPSLPTLLVVCILSAESPTVQPVRQTPEGQTEGFLDAIVAFALPMHRAKVGRHTKLGHSATITKCIPSVHNMHWRQNAACYHNDVMPARHNPAVS